MGIEILIMGIINNVTIFNYSFNCSRNQFLVKGAGHIFLKNKYTQSNATLWPKEWNIPGKNVPGLPDTLVLQLSGTYFTSILKTQLYPQMLTDWTEKDDWEQDMT